MARGVQEGVFPGAVLAVWHRDKCLIEAFGWRALYPRLETNYPDTVYDLASLTKPLATSLATMFLLAQGKLSLEDRPYEVLGGPPWFKEVQVWHLLSHRAGLPAYRPYFARLIEYPLAQRKEILMQWILDEPPAYPVGLKEIYSDLGFYILGCFLERKTGKDLALLFDQALEYLFSDWPASDRPALLFLPRRKIARKYIAPTEYCPWRGKILRGEVHDENTWVIGGVAGQAGLFGSAEAIMTLLLRLWQFYKGEKHCFPLTHVVKTFWDWGKPGERALGFDRPSPKHSSAGDLIAPDAVGHLGFTGTSFWIDKEKEVIIVLLTNRVHPQRGNEKIRAFRPALHQLILYKILKNSCLKA